MLWGKRKKKETDSSITWERDDRGVHVVRIRGLITDDTFKRLGDQGAQQLGTQREAKGLIVLEGFEGWGKGREAGNLNLMLRYDAQMEKLAVVGDLRWQEDFLMFLGAGYRHAKVRFFATEELQKARDWLG
jgi:hypothetical protein